MRLPTPLMVRRTDYEGRPTWTVAVQLPDGAVVTQSFWVDDEPTSPEPSLTERPGDVDCVRGHYAAGEPHNLACEPTSRPSCHDCGANSWDYQYRCADGSDFYRCRSCGGGTYRKV